MNSAAGLARAKSWRALVAILVAGAIAASLDLVFACTFHGLRSGASPVRILKSIASGWFGTDAMAGGVGVAMIGFVSHYAILIVAAALYFAATRWMTWMNRHAYLYGALFGLCIYVFMNWVVLPLSNAPHFNGSTVGTVADLSMHVLVIGPTIAVALRRLAPIATSTT